MRLPKVSVFIPAYNVEKYIAEAIQSILDQTFTDFELIVINDGSTDKTSEIVKSFNDPRIVFIENKENQKLVRVRNQGLEMARGEYLALMDADDISMPQRLAKQVAFLDANPEVGILGTDSLIWDTANPEKSYFLEEPETMDYVCVMKGGRPHHPTAMLRMSVIKQHNFRYNLDYFCCHDYELWSRMVRVTKIANLQEYLLKYRWHGENISIVNKKLSRDNNKRVQQNMVGWLSGDPLLQKELQKVVCGKRWTGIPLIRVRYTRDRVIYRLFGFLPIWIRKENKK